MRDVTNRQPPLSRPHTIKMLQRALGALAATLCLGAASGSHAALTVLSAYDSGTFVGPNVPAAFGAFNAAVGPSNAITFESLPANTAPSGMVAPGVSLASSGFITYAGAIPACQDIFCGGNTTPGGSKFALSNARDSFLEFFFLTPVSAFGVFFTGAQEFFDGTPSLVVDRVVDGQSANPTRTTVAVPADRFGGLAFVGVYDPDPDSFIFRVRIRVPNDALGVDDVRYVPWQAPAAVVPEPNTWAMMLIGFLGVGCLLRRSPVRSFRRTQAQGPQT
jgi:hypothetical protein